MQDKSNRIFLIILFNLYERKYYFPILIGLFFVINEINVGMCVEGGKVGRLNDTGELLE